MPSRDRRRARRRSIGVLVPALVVVAVALFLLIGGFAGIGRGSGPYRKAIDGSFASQAAVLAAQSNGTASVLDRLLGSFSSPDLQRVQLQHRLDELVASTASEARSAVEAVPPEPGSGAAPLLISAFGDRARAMTLLRRAVDGLLGIEVGGGRAGAPTLVPSSRVTAQLTQVGTELDRSDQAFAACRRALQTLGARPRPPASKWVSDPGMWSAGAVGTLVAQLSAPGPLTVRHQLTLVSTRVRPGTLPSPGAPGASVVPPTRRLSVIVVVANDGNVPEQGVVVQASAQPEGSGTPPPANASSSRTVALTPGTSAVEVLGPLAVEPGTTYVLTTSVVPKVAQSGGTLESAATIEVAPPAPPPTTTTTTTTTRPTTTTTTRPTTTTERRPTTTARP